MELSLDEARRLAVAAQGLGRRPAKPTIAHVKKAASAIGGFQLDSVNVLVRAHYLPAYSRLGPYRMDAIDKLAYKRRDLFEYWGHAACLFPIEMFPLFRYRMDIIAAASPWIPGGPSPESAYTEKVYSEISERGPIAAGELSDPGKRRGKWWGWSKGKTAIEHLFAAGFVAIAGRRGFERLYDITERVIPRPVLDTPAPDPEESRKQLLALAAKALGVARAQELIWFFGIDQVRAERPGAGGQRAKPVGKRLIAELVEEGRLVPVRVDGWREPAYIYPASRVPRTVNARSLVGPFDPLLRRDTEPLFGFKRRLAEQLYVPAERRVYGYYVLPFLLDDTIVAHCDLKADRVRGVLMVQSAHLEAGNAAGRVVGPLIDELRELQTWLGLESIEIARQGDLSAKLRKAL